MFFFETRCIFNFTIFSVTKIWAVMRVFSQAQFGGISRHCRQ